MKVKVLLVGTDGSQSVEERDLPDEWFSAK